MNVERLREENIKTPKIIHKLSKSDDPVLAPKAKEIVEKWKKMIETASGGAKPITKEANHKEHKKKRKKDNDPNNSDSKDSNESKKSKTTANVVDFNNTDSNDVSMDSVKSDDLSKPKTDRTPRPTTAKVKPGKSRLMGLVSSQNNSKAIKPRKEATNVTKNKLISNLNKTQNSLDVLNSLPVSSAKIQPKAIEIKSSTAPTTPPPSTITAPSPVVTPPAPAVKHVLQA